jgi:hypothetical protein
VTTTDHTGSVLSQQVVKKNQPASASGYDPATGITTNVQALPDGSKVIVKLDREGDIVSQEIQPPAAELPPTGSYSTTSRMKTTTHTTTHTIPRLVTTLGQEEE